MGKDKKKRTVCVCGCKYVAYTRSVASMMDGEEKAVMFKVDEMVIDDNEMEMLDNYSNDEIKIEEEDEFGLDKEYKTVYCLKTDGKGWQCRNEARHGHSLCDHHLSLLKSYSSSSSITHSVKKSDKAMAFVAGSRRGRVRTSKKGSSSSNPYEFYYYSGFGPSWGKRRGDKVIEEKRCELKGDESILVNDKTPSSSQIDNEEFDFVDDDDEEEENGDSGKKRTRKPVKARSLKSLM